MTLREQGRLHRGRRHLSLARIVPTELPHTWAAWQAGRIDEWTSTVPFLVTRAWWMWVAVSTWKLENGWASNAWIAASASSPTGWFAV